jgi:chaperonin GroEL (HSP60 family)
MDKILLDSLGGVPITNDDATILKKLVFSIQQPR